MWPRFNLSSYQSKSIQLEVGGKRNFLNAIKLHF